MNYANILGNFLVSFCTCAIAINFVGGAPEAIAGGLIAALIQAGLSVGKELQEESNPPEKGKKRTILSHLTLF